MAVAEGALLLTALLTAPHLFAAVVLERRSWIETAKAAIYAALKHLPWSLILLLTAAAPVLVTALLPQALPYVAYAVNNGIIETKYQSYTSAQMNAAVTRSEFVYIFYGALDHYPSLNTVADNAVPDVTLQDAYGDEIYTFYRAGILTGFDSKGTFHPDSSIKRSEAAAILIRMYDESVRESITLG